MLLLQKTGPFFVRTTHLATACPINGSWSWFHMIQKHRRIDGKVKLQERMRVYVCMHVCQTPNKLWSIQNLQQTSRHMRPNQTTGYREFLVHTVCVCVGRVWLILINRPWFTAESQTGALTGLKRGHDGFFHQQHRNSNTPSLIFILNLSNKCVFSPIKTSTVWHF